MTKTKPRDWPIVLAASLVESLNFIHRATRYHMLRQTNTPLRCGYHPANIWPEWFEEEPEEGSSVMSLNLLKQRPKASDRNACTDTTQP